ncbi:hypothetical protein O59_004247 [Cellvibrio sp. BR]|nr:hypothetical protein O59_004247 [Cellvibrio sp. BR]
MSIYLANKLLYSGKLRNYSVALISALLVYIFIIVSVAYINNKLDNQLAAFDLNGDGIFSGIEITPDQEKAMQEVIADTGRTFAPITGAIFCSIYFLVLWLVLTVFPQVVKLFSQKIT